MSQQRRRGRQQHKVVIRARGTQRKVVADLVGDDSPGGGIGGWEGSQAGKKKRPAMRFTGRSARTQKVVLMLDGYDTNTPVESSVRQIESWAAGRKGNRPPQVLVSGALLRSAKTVPWVITGVEYGEQIRRADGRRVRQELTVSFTEWSKPPPKKKKKPKKKADKKP